MNETYNVSILPGSVEVSVLPTVGVSVNMETNTIIASIEPATIIASVALYGGTGTSTAGNIAMFQDSNGVLLEDSGLQASSFASATQGSIAETALQPSDVGSAAYTSSTAYEASGAIATHSLQSSGVHNLGTVASHAFEEFQLIGTYVNSVSGTAPIVSSGGITPVISMSAATDLVDGYLTADDHTVYDAHVNSIDGNPHGTDHYMLDGLLDDDHSQYLLLAGRVGQTATTPLVLGTATDNTTIELDGTMVANGAATAYDDMLFDLQYEETDANATAGVLGTAGASQTGTFANTTRRDGILWVITEGGASGRMMELTFEDIRQVPVLFFTGRYDGSVAHAANLTWVVYNWTTLTWDALTFTWATATQYTDVAVPTGFTAQHVSVTGMVKVGVNHGSVVTAGHTLSLDEVYLIEDNQPSSVFFKGGRVLSFRNTGFDVAHGRVQFRHAYKVGSDFHWHVHFTNLQAVIADGETVIFTLTKSFAAIYNVFPTESTLTATFTNSSAWRAGLTTAQAASILTGTNVNIGSHLIAAGASAISGADQNISSIGMLEIIRSVGTHTSNVGVLYADFHIEQNTLGSRNEFTK